MIFGHKITQAEMESAIKNAVADATNASTLASHMAQCERDKGEIKAEQLRMHTENTKRFTTIEAQNARIMRFVWMAAGAIAVLHFVLSSGSEDVVKWFLK